MSRIASKYHTTLRPFVATPRREPERATAHHLDAVFWKADALAQSVPAARMRNVRMDDLLDHFWLGHFERIFTCFDDELESPKPIFRQPKVAAYRRSFGVTEETKI